MAFFSFRYNGQELQEDGSGAILCNFGVVGCGTAGVAGEDFTAEGDPRAARFHISDRSLGSRRAACRPAGPRGGLNLRREK